MPKRPGRTRTDQYDKFGKLILPDEPTPAEEDLAQAELELEEDDA